jgi:hypothetical protein
MTMAEKGWDLLNSDVMGKNLDSEYFKRILQSLLISDSTIFIQSPLDMMKSAVAKFPVTILSSLSETIVKTLSLRVGKFAIT